MKNSCQYPKLYFHCLGTWNVRICFFDISFSDLDNFIILHVDLNASPTANIIECFNNFSDEFWTNFIHRLRCSLCHRKKKSINVLAYLRSSFTVSFLPVNSPIKSVIFLSSSLMGNPSRVVLVESAKTSTGSL